jgi:3-oxoacyl-[acyl-carrier-protein] synthase II
MASEMNRTCGRRVVITGMGVIAANGQDLDTFWDSICKGKSAAKPISRFDTTDLPYKIAAEIRDFEPTDYFEPKKARRFELSVQYGVAAALAAVEDAQLNLAKVDSHRLGIVEGTSVSGMESSFKGQLAFLKKGYRGMSPFTLINAYCGGGSGEVALELGARGHAFSYSSGSASGNDAIGYAASLIQHDHVDFSIAGGTEAPLLAPLWGAFCLTRVMTNGIMRPFDKNRDGFLLGEGAGFVVLEELASARARGAKIYAEVIGHGRSCEAYHSVAPHPEGLGMYRAMKKAFRRAGAHPSEVDYINVHGTATETNDIAESRAIKRLFDHHADNVAVSSTKPVTGHLLAAAGALETVVCALSIHRKEIPFTLNLREPAENCTLDYVRDTSRPYPVRTVLNLNCGFGGKNSCLILRELNGQP